MQPTKAEKMEALPPVGSEAQKSSKNRKTIVFACGGICDYGKLTKLAATTLAFRKPNMYRAADAEKGIGRVEDAVSDGFRIMALEGCTEYCATKKLNTVGLKAEVRLMTPELGIDTTAPLNMKNMETLIDAIKDA